MDRILLQGGCGPRIAKDQVVRRLSASDRRFDPAHGISVGGKSWNDLVQIAVADEVSKDCLFFADLGRWRVGMHAMQFIRNRLTWFRH